MNEKKYYIIAALVGLAVACCYFIGSRNAGNGSDVYNDTDRTLERAEEQQRQLADEITGAGTSIGDAQNANERATTAISRSENAADEIAGSLDVIRIKVKECRELAERNAAILDGAAKEN